MPPKTVLDALIFVCLIRVVRLPQKPRSDHLDCRHGKCLYRRAFSEMISNPCHLRRIQNGADEAFRIILLNEVTAL